MPSMTRSWRRKVNELCQEIMPAFKDRIRDLIRSGNERLASKLAYAEDELARTRQDLRDKEEQLSRMANTSISMVHEAQMQQLLLLQRLSDSNYVENASKRGVTRAAPSAILTCAAALAPGGSGGLADYYLLGGSSSQKPAQVEFEGNAKLARKRKRDSYCDLCNVIMESKQVRKDHFKSRGHQQRQQKLKEKAHIVS